MKLLLLTIIPFLVWGCATGAMTAPKGPSGWVQISCPFSTTFQKAATFNPDFDYCRCVGRRAGLCDHSKQLEIHRTQSAGELIEVNKAIEELLRE